nr:unnamed protein product [Callosobruchus analis]
MPHIRRKQAFCTSCSLRVSIESIAFHLEGYVLASSYCRSVHKGGGVSIYASRDINYKQLPLVDLCIEKEFEICGISSHLSDLDDLSNEPMHELYIERDINEAFTTFSNIFLHYFEKHFPKRRRFISFNRNKEWVTDEVRRSSCNLKNLYYLKLCHPELEPSYKVEKSRHVQLIKETKKFFYQCKIVQSDNPVKSAWSTINQLSNKNRIQNQLAIAHNGQKVDDTKQIANLFNEYFRDSPINISKRVNQRATQNNTDIGTLTRFVQDTIFLFPYAPNELYNLINEKMRNKCTSGYDEVPMFLVKKVMPIIINHIVYLVNLSFASGIFPEKLKRGKLIPVYKKGNPHNMDNYRPITMPSAFSKILEYAFLNRFQQFLLKHNVYSKNQHGFVSKKSTNTAIHSYYEIIVRYIEDGECPVGIFCDLSKAFDCVNHRKLLDKLIRCGVRGKALNWIDSFLSNRSQFVSINEVAVSETLNINIGVPQGSVLGPFLFVLYVNDLDKLDVSANFTIYADDTSVIISHKDDELLQHKCNDVLSKVNSWFIENGLFLNASKTSVLRFHNKQKTCPPVSLSVNNELIESCKFDVAKFLGLYLDENLSWKIHCESIIAKITSAAYLFNNLRHVLSSGQLLILYYAQVESRLRYAICFWGTSTHAQDVFVSQKRALRSMAGLSKRETCRSLFREFNILTVPGLLIFEMCLYIFKDRNELTHICDIHSKNTRQKNKIYVPYRRYHVGYNAPDCLGLRLYNKLPSYIKESSNIKIFKTRLKKLLVELCIYKLDDFLV